MKKMDEFLHGTKAWIPCSERLPEEYDWYGAKEYGQKSDTVLVTMINKDVVNGKREPYRGDRFIHIGRFMSGRFIDNVYTDYFKPVAWMPFPEPYGEN
jgi:hypothetical protein